MLDPGFWSAGSIPWKRRLAVMTEECQAWSVPAMQLHGHEGHVAFLCCTLCTLWFIWRLCGGEGGKGSSDSSSEAGMCDVAVKAMPVWAWWPILSWQYSLINLEMMKNAELNSTEMKIPSFSLDQRFPGCPSPSCLSTELEGPSLCIRSFQPLWLFSCWFNCWFFQWECQWHG